MTNSRPTNVNLPHKLEETIDKLVESGQYMSASEVIREAIREHMFSDKVGTILYEYEHQRK